jgi:predicted DNA-binding WGR domain protein
MHEDHWTKPPAEFRCVLLDRTDPPKNAQRFYLVGWLPTLLDDGAVVMMYRRKGVSQRTRILTFPSLAVAWPTIRSTIRARLRHGYRIVTLTETEV